MNLIFFVSDYSGIYQQLREFDSSLGGALVLKDGQLDVKDFTAFYRLMTPQKNSRNPWFTELWEQVCSTNILYDVNFVYLNTGTLTT